MLVDAVARHGANGNNAMAVTSGMLLPLTA